MASRPTVSIATAEGKPSGASQPLPAVFGAPIRSDIVQYVKNRSRKTLFFGGEVLTPRFQVGPRWYGQEQASALRRQREGRRADLC